MLSLSGLSPEEGETLVSPSTLIEFTIVDDGNGIDISTLIVNIRGTRAVTGTTFTASTSTVDGFDGVLSAITTSSGDYTVVIDYAGTYPVGSIISVQIQIQDLTGLYYNITYVFKVVPDLPILVSSNPEDKSTITSPQLLSLEFEDTIDGIDNSSIDISINDLAYMTNGIAVAAYNGVLTDITATADGVVVRIDPDESLRSGDYILKYAVADNSGNTLRGQIRFAVDLEEQILPEYFPQVQFLGFFQGIKRVSDVGCGDSLLVEWNSSIGRSYNSETFILVYENQYRLDVFDDGPTYLATSSISQAYTNGLSPGVTLSYGARALEFPRDTFDPTGMQVVENNFYRLPSAVTLIQNFDDDDLIIRVNSVAGYPAAGFLRIGNEIIRYTSKSAVNNTFLVPSNGREAFNTIASLYLAGDSVELYLEMTDRNTVIIMATPTYQDGYRSGRELDYEGFVVTDYTDNDAFVFPGYDFCGYHDPLPQQTLQGQNDCGSYLGGEFNGLRGFDLYSRMLNREEVLLDQVGEPTVLLKRIWDGEICSCMDLRKMGPKVKACTECYGTGFIGGYQQYLNLRRADRRIITSFDESPEDLMLGEKEHLQQEYEPSAWTLPQPAIRDRDVLIRFDFSGDIEFIYEVLNVSREKLLHGKFGRQRMALRRIDKTDILYTVKYI